jgi:hypothetical protein
MVIIDNGNISQILNNFFVLPAIIRLTNKLLINCKITKQINSVDEISSHLILSIYEYVCSSELVGKLVNYFICYKI